MARWRGHVRHTVRERLRVPGPNAARCNIEPSNHSKELIMKSLHSLLLRAFIAFSLYTPLLAQEAASPPEDTANTVVHGTVEVDGVEMFYREAGPQDAPTILLLHGYPTSSHMYRNLMRDLSDSYHMVAPDYPGFGRSEQPPMAEFDYTFERMSEMVEGFIEAKSVDSFYLYLMDYGAPIGLRVAMRHPEKVRGLIIQNGAAYEEGLLDFWDPLRSFWETQSPEIASALEGFHAIDGLKWQYTHGTGDRENRVSPDNWEIDLRHLTRPENNEIQLAMFYDYQTNVALYPAFQAYFREYQPPALVVYGKNDVIFPEAGAQAYKKDLNNIDFNLYDTGHFALETHGREIALKMKEFLGRQPALPNEPNPVDPTDPNEPTGPTDTTSPVDPANPNDPAQPGTSTPPQVELTSIQGVVWFDLANDANPDNDQLSTLGVGGVTVNLSDMDGVLVAMTSTDTEGRYRFDVPAGMYRLSFDASTLPNRQDPTTRPGVIDTTAGNVSGANLGLMVEPTAVQLMRIEATKEKSDGTTIRWKTGWEDETLGFRVWRGTVTGPVEPLEPFVLSQGGDAEYEVRDVDAAKPVTHYWLEEVETDLTSTFVGHAWATIPSRPLANPEKELLLKSVDKAADVEVRASSNVLVLGFDREPVATDVPSGLRRSGEILKTEGGVGLYLGLPPEARVTIGE